MIGYCPQTNPIFESLTVEEHVDYYAQIKGIPAYLRKTLVDSVIAELDLFQHKEKAAG